MEPFVGMLLLVPYTYAPRGWAFCQGQILSIAQYQTLFSLLGSNFGGDGVSSFALPDLQGRYPMGAGQYPGMPEYRIGGPGGAPYNELTVDDLPSHTHQLYGTAAAGSTNNPSDALPAVSMYGRDGVNTYATGGAPTSMASNAIGNTGKGGAIENRPPFLVMNYIIALDGIYPPRP